MNELDRLIPEYYEDKEHLDGYKKICDESSARIKQLMQAENLDKYEVDYEHITNSKLYATMSISQRKTMNEDALLARVKELGRQDLIRTKEYVDYDLLEKALYAGDIQESDISGCMNVKEVCTLRVSKKGGKNNE